MTKSSTDHLTPAEMRALRKSVGWIQPQLADAIGMSVASIKMMETGKMPIEKRTAIAVSAVIELALAAHETAA